MKIFYSNTRGLDLYKANWTVQMIDSVQLNIVVVENKLTYPKYLYYSYTSLSTLVFLYNGKPNTASRTVVI